MTITAIITIFLLVTWCCRNNISVSKCAHCDDRPIKAIDIPDIPRD